MNEDGASCVACVYQGQCMEGIYWTDPDNKHIGNGFLHQCSMHGCAQEAICDDGRRYQ